METVVMKSRTKQKRKKKNKDNINSHISLTFSSIIPVQRCAKVKINVMLWNTKRFLDESCSKDEKCNISFGCDRPAHRRHAVKYNIV